MEKRLSQTLLRNQLKGKRSMEKPYKYMVNSLEGLPRYAQVIIYPRNKFEKVLSNSFERMMPTLHYFTHQLTMERYSESGWFLSRLEYSGEILLQFLHSQDNLLASLRSAVSC